MYNFIKIFYRNLWRNRVFSAINIVGLSIGLAGSFFLMLYIFQETGYNKCYKNWRNIYRVLENRKQFNMIHPHAPYYFAEYVKKDFPEIKASARMGFIFGASLKKGEEYIPEYGIFAADPSLFDIFTLPVIAGNKEDFLKTPASVVLTKKLADKYFDGGDALGKEMKMRLDGEEYLLRVDGIIENIPKKSTLIAGMFCHIDFVWERSKRFFSDEKLKYSWELADYETYLLLPDGYDIGRLKEKMPAFIKKYVEKETKSEYDFQALSDIYFGSQHLSNCRKWGDIHKIYTFALIAFLILFIAATNYIILSTAQSVTRFKEIGIRKTIGANRLMLVGQIFSESITTSILAVPFSILIMHFSLPYVNDILNARLQLSLLSGWKAIVGLLAITIVVGLVSGSYLAVFLSRLNPVEVLKNTNMIKSSRSWFRFALITLQIIIFVVLLIFLQTISLQINYAQNSDLGYDKENLIKIYVDEDFVNRFPGYREELKQNPDIVDVSAAIYMPPYAGWQKISVPHTKEPGKNVVLESLDVDYDFIKTLGLKLLEGRTFSREYGADSINAVVISKSAIEALGLPGHPVGLTFKTSDTSGYNIIGVFDDIYMRSFKEKITPIILRLSKMYLSELIVRYRPGTDSAAIAFLKKKMDELSPGAPMDYISVKDAIGSLYFKEMKLKKTINVFTLLAIFISMLGLFALSVFLIKQKTNVIGIRKVFGATTRDIIRLVAAEFLAMVMVANVIAVPVAVFVSNRWLSGYAYHIAFTLRPYIIAFAASLVLVFVTVVISAFKTANINPAESIKYQG